MSTATHVDAVATRTADMDISDAGVAEIEYPLPGSEACCDSCDTNVFRFYHCVECGTGDDCFDLCEACYSSGEKLKEHLDEFEQHTFVFVAPTTSAEELVEDLIYAGRTGDIEEIKRALASGAAVDGRDGNGTAALMMACANGHVEAIQHLLDSGADINAINATGNTALHWSVLTGQQLAIKTLLSHGGCNLLIKNQHGSTAAMEAEQNGKGEIVELLLDALQGDEEAAAEALGHVDSEAWTEEERVQQIEQAAGVDQTLDTEALKTWQEAPAGEEAATRGVLTGDLLLPGAGAEAATGAGAAEGTPTATPPAGADGDSLVTRERPLRNVAIERLVEASAASRQGDWRYSLMPGVVPRPRMEQFSRDFFRVTELLQKDGNTFGPEFEQQYKGHKNYFYYMNRNSIVPGAEKAAFIFEELDHYTRAVVEHHHPGVPVRLERAFGAYYEGERAGFHLGVNEHCDGDANLVSTVVHAVLPDGDVGFTEGGELTVSAVDALPSQPIVHSNETVGSVVYLGSSIFHHASPIAPGSKRLVFCMFYASKAGTDLSKHALANPVVPPS